jgi:hypothetical protein
MNRRAKWLKRMASVVQEYLAGQTAADWLDSQIRADSSFGWTRGWEPAGGEAFIENLEATYIIRLYAEFEAVRDYWESYRGRDSRSDMVTLVRPCRLKHSLKTSLTTPTTSESSEMRSCTT